MRAVKPIIINAANGCADVVWDGQRLQNNEVNHLATSDGFKDVTAFANFFYEKYGGELSAYLIEWHPVDQRNSPMTRQPQGGKDGR